MLRITLIAISVTFAAGLLFVNYYNSVVDAVNWAASIPGSIATTRQYYSVAHPGTFFRIASPLNQLFALITVIACWKFGRARYFAIGALVLAISADLLTFGYFYPRLDIMFHSPISNTEAIRQAVADWSSMNWVRSGICAVSVICTMSALVITVKKSSI